MSRSGRPIPRGSVFTWTAPESTGGPHTEGAAPATDSGRPRGGHRLTE